MPLAAARLHRHQKWARDIEAMAPINMCNTDIEKIRDALGSLDYRITDLQLTPLGQAYEGKFNPPMRKKIFFKKMVLIKGDVIAPTKAKSATMMRAFCLFCYGTISYRHLQSCP